jgi:hypothetical protein
VSETVTRRPEAPEAAKSDKARRALIKSVALPSEHGGWSFLVEPLLLGLLVAFSWAGALLSVATVAAFLPHHPLKTAIKHARAGRRAPRTAWARRFALGDGVKAAAALAAVLALAPPRVLLALLAAAPFAAVQLYYDAKNKSRALAAEICGAVALATMPPAIAAISGWPWQLLFGLWLLPITRAIPSILYVRARLHLEHGKPAERTVSHVAHGAAVLAAAAAAQASLVPWLSEVALGVLLLRSVHGLSPWRIGRTARAVGMQEIAFGLLAVIVFALGYAITRSS